MEFHFCGRFLGAKCNKRMRLKAHNAELHDTLYAIIRMHTYKCIHAYLHTYVDDMCSTNAFGIAELSTFFHFYLSHAPARIKTLSANLGLSFVLTLRFLFYLLGRFNLRRIAYWRGIARGVASEQPHTPILTHAGKLQIIDIFIYLSSTNCPK